MRTENGMETAMRKEIDELSRMTVGQLRQKYIEAFGEESRSNHKQFLFRRIAWRMQALAEGGLSERARRRALEIANDADLRIRAPKTKFGDDVALDPKLSVTRKVAGALDPRLPPPGTYLEREYKGRRIIAKILEDGFEFDGEIYRSLSAMHLHIPANCGIAVPSRPCSTLAASLHESISVTCPRLSGTFALRPQTGWTHPRRTQATDRSATPARSKQDPCCCFARRLIERAIRPDRRPLLALGRHGHRVGVITRWTLLSRRHCLKNRRWIWSAAIKSIEGIVRDPVQRPPLPVVADEACEVRLEGYHPAVRRRMIPREFIHKIGRHANVHADFRRRRFRRSDEASVSTHRIIRGGSGTRGRAGLLWRGSR